MGFGEVLVSGRAGKTTPTCTGHYQQGDGGLCVAIQRAGFLGRPYSYTVVVDPFNIDNDIPSADKMAGRIRKLQCNRVGGPSGLCSEHLKLWLEEAEAKTNPDDTKWLKVLELIQAVFGQGELPTKLFWLTIVLLPNGGGDFHGIQLVEVIWEEVIAIIINNWLASSVEYHDLLHVPPPLRQSLSSRLRVCTSNHSWRSFWISIMRLMMPWIGGAAPTGVLNNYWKGQ